MGRQPEQHEGATVIEAIIAKVPVKEDPAFRFHERLGVLSDGGYVSRALNGDLLVRLADGRAVKVELGDLVKAVLVALGPLNRSGGQS